MMNIRLRMLWAAVALPGAALLSLLHADTTGPDGKTGPAEMVIKTESFDRDPDWEGFNNRIIPKRYPTIKQDFGYSETTFTGKTKGEIGGQVWRSTTPAYYAQRITKKTLDDKLSASGSFSLTATSGGCGLFFGWFNARQPGGGRPISSLGWSLDGEKSGARLSCTVVSATNRANGGFVTPFERGKKILPLKPDESKHTWAISYDPDAAGGNGSIRFTLDDGKPVVTELPAGFKKEGATFDRFGLMNVHKAGGALSVYVGDLQVNGNAVDLTRDPGWEGSGNRTTFEDHDLTGAQNFGFSDSAHSGGKRGEVGGVFWRAKTPFAYYADKVGPLSLDDPLTASGKIAFTVGAPDSGMYFGWFNSSSKDDGPEAFKNFVGVHIEGPSRVGHYFRPVYATAKGKRNEPSTGPIIVPDGKSHNWTLAYDPKANGADGVVTVTLDKESCTLKLEAGHRKEDATLDRFGIFTVRAGGSQVKIYLDDLKYTAGRPSK